MLSDALASYPYYLRDVKEIEYIAEREEAQLEALQSYKNYRLNEANFYIFLAPGHKRWETVLGEYESLDQSEEDLVYIKKKLNQEKLVTVKSLDEYLKWRYGEGKYSIEYNADSLVLNVTVNAVPSRVNGLYEKLREFVPCNIEIYVERAEA